MEGNTALDKKELLPHLADQLHKDFSLDKNSLPVLDDFSMIREQLIIKVKELMSRSYSQFINGLYRIDVDETKVREIIHAKDKTRIPERLADLIIERQLVRVKTRMLYKERKI
jgi:hypothetical protein